jgi:hypothetical protein
MKKNVLIAIVMCLMATSQLFAQTITGFTPTSAKAGASVVITGTGLTGTTIVQFGGVNAASFVVNSSTQITATLSTGGNSGFVSLTNGATATSTTTFNFLSTLRNPLVEGDVVINKVYNNQDPDGTGDAIEILVVKDDADLRALYIKDWKDGKDGGFLSFFLKETPFFQHLRAGTLIVLRKNTGASADVDPSDFKMDLNLLDVNYCTAGNATNATTPSFNIGSDDIMSLQKSASGTDGILAMLGSGPTVDLELPPFGPGRSSSFNSGIYTRLNSYTTVTPGNFVWVTNRNSTITDYHHVGAAANTSYVTADNADRVMTGANNDDATPAALVLGSANNAKNLTYITNLRVIGSTVLPVSLISFTAKATTNGVAINWATASEQNNNRFELQRSADGNSFITIKTVTGANNANSRNNYSFLDKNPIAGVNYYKLVQIDNDGTVKELGVQAVSSDSKGLAFNVSSYGDVNQINYTVYATTSVKANVSVFDLSGKQVANITIDLSAGNNNLKINSNNLKSGVYVAVLKAENNTLTSKFVK